MRDGDIDDVVKQAAGAAPEVDPALLDRISRSLQSSLHPVRPLPPSWLLASLLILISTAIALAGAILLGPYGIQKMRAVEAAFVFSSLGVLICVAASMGVAEMTPGSRRPIAPGTLALAACAALAVLFGLFFHEDRTGRFIPQGLVCLGIGLGHALPAGLLIWWALSRGFAVNSTAAGLAKGALAGMTGVALLELHCPNFEAAHVMVWHIVVIPISCAAGALVARRRQEPR
jgi:hypothetical protein